MVVGHETGLACDERIAARIMNAEELTAATSQSVQSHVHARNLITAVVLVAVADWLFYGHPLGVSAAVFVVSLGVGTAMSYPVRARGADWTIATTVLAFSVAPLITRPGILAMAFGALGVAYFATTLHDADSPLPFRFDGAGRRIRDIGWRVVPDLYRAGSDWRRRGPVILNPSMLLIWIVPFGLGAVFLGLFTAANPVIDNGLSSLAPLLKYATIPPERIAGWLFILSLIWPFIVARRVDPAGFER